MPPGASVPLVGLSDSHGTSAKAGTPLSIRNTVLGSWSIIHRLPSSSISRPAPSNPGLGCGSVASTAQVSGLSS